MPFEPMPDASFERDSGQQDSGGRDDDSGAESDAAAPDPFVWPLPAWLPTPVVPDDNPMSDAKVELGRHLFYDVRLSENETQSCASCHVQALAFTDGLALAVGSTGEEHPRNSMALANVAFYDNGKMFWDERAATLEQQVLVSSLTCVLQGRRQLYPGGGSPEEWSSRPLQDGAPVPAVFIETSAELPASLGDDDGLDVMDYDVSDTMYFGASSSYSYGGDHELLL
jgi:mono/diheme cytochrome c family protein